MTRRGATFAFALTLAAGALALMMLADRVRAVPVAVRQVDGFWGRVGFCARTPDGLACWDSHEGNGAPVIVQGLARVTDVAVGSNEACALAKSAVACFKPGRATATPVPFESPMQVVAAAKFNSLMCVLHANGVSCWAHDDKPTLRREIGKPERLFDDAIGRSVCGVYDDGTRCFPIGNHGETDAGIFLPNVKAPMGVTVETGGGHVWVVDGDQALYGEFKGTFVLTGNPFASDDPLALASASAKRPFTGATVSLKPVPGIGKVRAMAAESISPIVLDEKGVAQLDVTGIGFDIKRWPTADVPTALSSGSYNELVTIEDGAVHQHGWHEGDRFDHQVTGITAPKLVIADPTSTCALDAAGGIACVPSQQPE